MSEILIVSEHLPDLVDGATVVVQPDDLPDQLPPVIVFDQRLSRDEWRARIDAIFATPQIGGCELFVLAPTGDDAGDLFTTNEIIRRGMIIIEDLGVLEPIGLPKDAHPVSHEPAAPGASEFRTLLESGSSRTTLNALVEAALGMRRETPMPLWDVVAPGAEDLKGLGAPETIAEVGNWEQDEPGTWRSKKKRPPLRNLLQAEYENEASKFFGYADPARWEWDPAQRTHTVPPAVLLTGPTGTGKSATARVLHEALFPDDHQARPLREVSAPNLRLDDWDNQLFGNTDEGWSSIGAVVGPAVEAAYGTLFIDEIGELELEGQSKLLTFLTRRMANIRGISGEVFLPVQIVAATSRPLEEMVRAGEFRQELLNRFRFRIELSSLVARVDGNRGELARLVEEFLAEPGINPPLQRGPRRGELAVTHFSDDLVDELARRRFETGNFREIIDVLSLGVAAAARRRSPVLTVDDLPLDNPVVDESVLQPPIPLDVSLDDLRDRFESVFPTANLRQVMRSFGAPALMTSDGHCVAIAKHVLWLEIAPGQTQPPAPDENNTL